MRAKVEKILRKYNSNNLVITESIIQKIVEDIMGVIAKNDNEE